MTYGIEKSDPIFHSSECRIMNCVWLSELLQRGWNASVAINNVLQTVMHAFGNVHFLPIEWSPVVIS